jgi:hypothetical protein
VRRAPEGDLPGRALARVEQLRQTDRHLDEHHGQRPDGGQPQPALRPRPPRLGRQCDQHRDHQRRGNAMDQLDRGQVVDRLADRQLEAGPHGVGVGRQRAEQQHDEREAGGAESQRTMPPQRGLRSRAQAWCSGLGAEARADIGRQQSGEQRHRQPQVEHCRQGAQARACRDRTQANLDRQ